MPEGTEELRQRFRKATTMAEKLAVLNEERELVSQGGGAEAQARQHEQGRLTAQERLGLLFDPGTFQGLDQWHRPYETGLIPGEEGGRGDGVIVGFGHVHSRPITLWAQDATVLGGSLGTVHARKVNMIMRGALDSRTPIVGIFDGEGVRAEDAIQYPDFYSTSSMAHFQTTASGVIPKIALVMGPCSGELSIIAGLSDFVFMVRDSSFMHLAPPPPGTTGRELGDAWGIHARTSGVCDILADNEEDCLAKCRELLSLLPSNNTEKPPVVDTGDDPERRDEELLELVPVDSSKPYSMHRLISLIVDSGKFLEVKRHWAGNLITGFARMGGGTVGIVANNPQDRAGCMTLDAADKMSRFIRFCDAFNIPLLWLCDTPAFLPAVEEEVRALIRHGCGVIFGNTEATVPQMTITPRKRYGGGALAMPGQMLTGDVHVAWPSFEPGLMGAEGAVSIVYRRELGAIEDEEKRAQQKQKRMDEMEVGLDNLIRESVQDFLDPRDTRPYIIKTLRWLAQRHQELPPRRHENIRL